ncbi:MAG TPA: glycoside hydrolase family 2 TIM barrel-domain containing protein [Bryobacteraceae bacterium]|nr:glycoside hydrolase family 2 TIM barrel-domain containing protein [Bryobacteraceae bacterium]
MRLLLAAALAAAACAETRIDLAGQWERRIAGKIHDVIQVPSSYRPIGTVTLHRTFELPAWGGQRVLLRFEGVAHHAAVRVNGKEAGSMGPWTPYAFDVTALARPGSNEIDVDVTDWQVPLGPAGAWEASGGIIRAVGIELRPDPYIENARLDYDFSPQLDSVACTLTVYLEGRTHARGRLTAELVRGAAVVARAEQEVEAGEGSTSAALRWKLDAPALWSPETPNLYTLRVRLATPRGTDEFATTTGFRKLEIRGNAFLLNGAPLVLHGVCRHDLWPRQGHTMTDAQIEQDMDMIRRLGANYVRLVHYPHDRRVVQAAARAGLLVSEESGLVWLQFRKLAPESLETGLGNLERTLRRDWNSPALFAMYVANESAVTPEAMREARKRLSALKPGLFLSSAHVSGPEAGHESSKRMFDEGGLDFYCFHPYTFDMDDFEKVATSFAGKPLVFTEWGGRAIGDSPVLMEATCREIRRLVEAGRLAGFSFWSWADLPEFSRQDAEMEGGILKSGVVTEERVPRPGLYAALGTLFRALPAAPPEPDRTPQLLAPALVPLGEASEFTPVPLQRAIDEPAQKQAWAEMEETIQAFWTAQGFTGRHWQETGKRFWTWSAPRFRIGRIPFETPQRGGATEPLVLTPSRRRVEVPVGRQADRLLFLGNVTFPDGYPVKGALGGAVGRYIVTYTDGERQIVELRWGHEVARANLISVATRIDPETAEGERAILFTKDPVREVYQARLLAVPVKPKRIERVAIELAEAAAPGAPPPQSMHHSPGTTPGPERQALALFAITAERGPAR